MTRTMGDAIHDQVPVLVAAGLPLVAGYVTGTADIKWTPADWSLFPAGQVTIDQGYQSPPVTTAVVRDVEQGAWSIAAAVNLATWQTARPTIYCSLSNYAPLVAAGWNGDVWIADWTGSPPPRPPGPNVVAVQYTDQGGGGAYDLSVVFDDTWPVKGDPMATVQVQNDVTYCGKCGAFYYGAGTVSVCAAGGAHAPANNVSFGLVYAQ